MDRSDPEYGATAIGLFILADDYLASARAAADTRLSSTGPIRLLCLHACELYLKAYLRHRGMANQAMVKLRHDLRQHADEAIGRGLVVSKAVYNDLGTVSDARAYVDSRYVTGSVGGPFSTSIGAIGLAQLVREDVRVGLDNHKPGMPNAL